MCEEQAKRFSEPGHVMYHVIEVEKTLSAVRLGRDIGYAAITAATSGAKYVLDSAPPTFTPALTSRLEAVRDGNLAEAAYRPPQLKLSSSL